MWYHEFMKSRIFSSETVRTIGLTASKYPSVVAGYLFGSVAKGNNQPTSDVDVGFICTSIADMDIRAFMLSIERCIALPDVDVVVADEYERPLILKEMMRGFLLYETSLGARAALETRILHRLEDYTHLRAISDRYVRRSFQKGVYAH